MATELNESGAMTLRFDAGLHYNSQLRYPGGVATLQTRKAMNKIKLELHLKTDPMLLIYAKNHDTKMTGNADFASPVPDAAAYSGKVTAYEDSLTGVTGAQNALTAALAKRDTKRLDLESALRDRAGYVETTSGGDPVKIAGAGFQLVSAPAPLGPLPAPQNVRVAHGANPGELLVRWLRVKGAGGYILKLSFLRLCRHEKRGNLTQPHEPNDTTSGDSSKSQTAAV